MNDEHAAVAELNRRFGAEEDRLNARLREVQRLLEDSAAKAEREQVRRDSIEQELAAANERCQVAEARCEHTAQRLAAAEQSREALQLELHAGREGVVQRLDSLEASWRGQQQAAAAMREELTENRAEREAATRRMSDLLVRIEARADELGTILASQTSAFVSAVDSFQSKLASQERAMRDGFKQLNETVGIEAIGAVVGRLAATADERVARLSDDVGGFQRSLVALGERVDRFASLQDATHLDQHRNSLTELASLRALLEAQVDAPGRISSDIDALRRSLIDSVTSISASVRTIASETASLVDGARAEHGRVLGEVLDRVGEQSRWLNAMGEQAAVQVASTSRQEAREKRDQQALSTLHAVVDALIADHRQHALTLTQAQVVPPVVDSDGSGASASAAGSAPDLRQLLALSAREFIAAAYELLLGREPDRGGVETYLDQLKSGSSKLAVLVDIKRSAEAKTRGAPLAGIEPWEKRLSGGLGNRWVRSKDIWNFNALLHESMAVSSAESARLTEAVASISNRMSGLDASMRDNLSLFRQLTGNGGSWPKGRSSQGDLANQPDAVNAPFIGGAVAALSVEQLIELAGTLPSRLSGGLSTRRSRP